MKRHSFINIGIAVFFLVAVTTMGFGSNWILNSSNDTLPADLEAKVTAAGGTLVKTINEIGIAVASFDSREAANLMTAHDFTVMPDLKIQFVNEMQQAATFSIGDDETYYPYQWHLPVIEADRAWDEGATGAGVRVAVLDTGIWYPHPDLYYNMDFVSSASFVPGVTDFIDDNGHGTHVAGIIAAADDGWGAIGVAPDATLVAVKVLDSTGAGSFSWIVDGIYHAANSDVDIINMSLGGSIRAFGEDPYYTAQEAMELIWTIAKAIIYAKSKGCLVVCAAGNDAMDLDNNEDIIVIPAEVGGLAVSATGPTGLADFDNFAYSYSNYGWWSIYLSAPGGEYTLYPADGWWLDMVFSTDIGGWSWMAGTSQAAPMVSGVAALVLSQDGPMPYWWLKYRLRRTSDDLGTPWKDKYYGYGRINAYKAVTNTR